MHLSHPCVIHNDLMEKVPKVLNVELVEEPGIDSVEVAKRLR